jgi:hypothetical protein
MKNSTACCQNLENLRDTASPFTKIIALDWYDGPTGGILQCQNCQAVYQFDMLDWDYHQVRIFRLRSLPEESWTQIVALLEQAGFSPSWPVWFQRKWPSEKAREITDKKIKKILGQVKPAEVVVAWLGYGEKLLATKKIPSKDLEKEPVWFDVEDLSEVRDWFSLLGLTRGRDYRKTASVLPA